MSLEVCSNGGTKTKPQIGVAVPIFLLSRSTPCTSTTDFQSSQRAGNTRSHRALAAPSYLSSPAEIRALVRNLDNLSSCPSQCYPATRKGTHTVHKGRRRIKFRDLPEVCSFFFLINFEVNVFLNKMVAFILKLKREALNNSGVSSGPLVG